LSGAYHITLLFLIADRCSLFVLLIILLLESFGVGEIVFIVLRLHLVLLFVYPLKIEGYVFALDIIIIGVVRF